MPKDKYELHMVSFKNRETGGLGVMFGDGANLLPYYLDVMEAWLAKQRAKQDEGSDLV